MLEEGERNDWFQSGYIVRLAAIAAVGLVLFIWRELTARRAGGESAHPAQHLLHLGDSDWRRARPRAQRQSFSASALPAEPDRLRRHAIGNRDDAAQSRHGCADADRRPVLQQAWTARAHRLRSRHLRVRLLGTLAYSRPTSGFWDIFWPQFWQGVGFSLIFVALSTAALATISKPQDDAGHGPLQRRASGDGKRGNRDRGDAAHQLRRRATTTFCSESAGMSNPATVQFLQKRDGGDDPRWRRQIHSSAARARTAGRLRHASGDGAGLQPRLHARDRAVRAGASAGTPAAPRTTPRGRRGACGLIATSLYAIVQQAHGSKRQRRDPRVPRRLSLFRRSAHTGTSGRLLGYESRSESFEFDHNALLNSFAAVKSGTFMPDQATLRRELLTHQQGTQLTRVLTQKGATK